MSGGGTGQLELFIDGSGLAIRILSHESKTKNGDERLHTRKNIIICIVAAIA